MPITELVAAVRPKQWLHFAVLPLAGFDPSAPRAAASMAVARGVAIAFCVLAYGYLLNGIADRRLDRDRGKNPLVGRRGSLAPFWAAAAVLAAAAALTAALSSSTVLAATLVSLGVGAVYSIGPRLKAVPGVCTVLNAGCFAPLLLVGVGGDRVGAPLWALVVCFSALLLQNQLLHEAADAEDDRRGGLRTTFDVLGPRGTAVAALAAALLLAAASTWLASARGAPLLLAVHAAPYAIVFPMLLARHGLSSARMARARTVHRALSAMSGALLFGATLA